MPARQLSQHSPYNGYIAHQGGIWKIIDTPLFSQKMRFLIKCIVIALYEVEVQLKVCSRLSSAKTLKNPILIQNGRCHLVRLGVKQNRVLTAFSSTNPWCTDTFKGGVPQWVLFFVRLYYFFNKSLFFQALSRLAYAVISIDPHTGVANNLF